MFQTRVVENQNTHFMFSEFFFQNRALYETVCKNMVEYDGPQVTISCGSFALHAGHIRLDSQNMKYALLFYTVKLIK
jgi:hypothetical protein